MSEIHEADCEAAKAYLSSYRCAERELSMRLQELSRLKALAEQVSAVVAPGMRADSLGRIQALEAEAADAVGRLCVLRHEIETAIGRVEDDTLREILQRHYVQMQTFREIAEALHYTSRHVSRLHKKALQHVLVCPVPPVL